jgi:uncharacterized membrane protein YdbT with pleckstrin-like domain
MHPVAVIRPAIVILAGAVAAGFVTEVAARSGSLRVAEVIWVLWGVLAVWQGSRIATWWRRYFVVTENRLMLITSLVDTDVGMMPLTKVTDMRLHQNTFGHLLGYAELIVESAGQDQALSRIPFVPYPSQMYQEILSLIFSPKPQGGNGGDLVPRQATFARSESSLADAITRYSVSSPSAYRRVMRSREREGEGRGCVGRFLVGR